MAKKYDNLPKEPRTWFDSYIIIYNVKGGTKTIPIVLSPTGISENLSASFDQQTSAGRSAPVISYSSTGARTINFNMRVSADMLPSGYGKNTKNYISALKALLFPDYSSSIGIIKSPHCLVVIGKLKLDGVCTSFGATYQDIFGKNGQHTVVDVDLSFTEVLKNAPGNVNIIEQKVASNDTNIGSAYEEDPILTLSGDGIGANSNNPYKYEKGINNIVGENGGATVYPVSLCKVGYTLKKGTEVVYNTMYYDINDIFGILNGNGAKSGNIYLLFYHLFYQGAEVDKQEKCRKIQIK